MIFIAQWGKTANAKRNTAEPLQPLLRHKL